MNALLPEIERLNHYFDAWVWFEQTGPVNALIGAPAEGPPVVNPLNL